MNEKDIRKAQELLSRKTSLLAVQHLLNQTKNTIYFELLSVKVGVRSNTLLDAVDLELSYINRNMKILGVTEIE